MYLQNHDRTIIVVSVCLSFVVNSIFWGWSEMIRRPVEDQVKIEQARSGIRREDAEVRKSEIDNCKQNGGKWEYSTCKIQ